MKIKILILRTALLSYMYVHCTFKTISNDSTSQPTWPLLL